ncbi:hypothetical protein PAEAM_28510 [Paenibacillus sp. GM1FR]|nr:hypothetical protein PAEAM_28510 [Paenibacillus sp. GM1FR]
MYQDLNLAFRTYNLEQNTNLKWLTKISESEIFHQTTRMNQNASRLLSRDKNIVSFII